jgi:protein phosphatase
VLRSLNGNLDEPGDVIALDLVPGDRVLLASDGLTDLVAEHRIEELLAANADDAAAQALVDEALTMGGRDNVTCLVATIIDGPEVVADGALIGAVRDPRNVVDAGAVRMPHSA